MKKKSQNPKKLVTKVNFFSFLKFVFYCFLVYFGKKFEDGGKICSEGVTSPLPLVPTVGKLSIRVVDTYYDIYLTTQKNVVSFKKLETTSLFSLFIFKQ